jgi:hypothetical protein
MCLSEYCSIRIIHIYLLLLSLELSPAKPSKLNITRVELAKSDYDLKKQYDLKKYA